MSETTAAKPTTADAAKIVPDEELIFVLGQALHQAGLPAHRVESTLARVADRLGLRVHSFCLPTGLLLSSEREGLWATRLIRLPPKPADLERLRRLTIEAEALAAGRPSPGEAVATIKALVSVPPLWGHAVSILGFVLSAAAFSVFFRGGLRELVVATIVGLAVGLVALLFGNARGASRRFELTEAAVAAFVAAVANAYLGSFVHWIPLASGLVILLPGLSLVDSIEELANGHLASGSSRMAGVGVAFLALIFGVLLGVSLADLLVSASPPDEAIAFPWWMAFPALVVVSLGSLFRFQARLADGPWILLASTVALVGARLGARLGNPLMGPFVGALLLGLTANLVSRMRLAMPQLLIVPGLALLVPGSFGLRSLNSMLSGASTEGLEQGFQMFMMAIALVSGLLFSNALVKTEANS
jgi:uncharacterized membrane protein YjjP (DUF1212 family)